MLLCTMYHHINSDKFSNSKDIFEKHLEYLENKFNIVLPGDKLSLRKINLCLVFDDGYYDFYYFVFPLLKKYNTKAVLSVPVKYILEDTKLPSDRRLSIKHFDMMKGDNYIKYAPFCTWKELKEMVDSKLVKIASHSFSHVDITQENIDLDLEFKNSKKIIESKISQSVDSFVFPYGSFNKKVKSTALEYYKFLFGMGGIDNIVWNGFKRVLYRISGDNLVTFNNKLTLKFLLIYKFRRIKWQMVI